MINPLTAKEQTVVMYVAEGMSNQDIGRKLYHTEDYVSTMCSRIMRKLGKPDYVSNSNSRAWLVAYCLRRGFIG